MGDRRENHFTFLWWIARRWARYPTSRSGFAAALGYRPAELGACGMHTRNAVRGLGNGEGLLVVVVVVVVVVDVNWRER